MKCVQKNKRIKGIVGKNFNLSDYFLKQFKIRMSDQIDEAQSVIQPEPDQQPKKRQRRAKTEASEKIDSIDQSDSHTDEPKQRKKAKNSNMSVEYENFKVGFGKKNDVVMTPDELYKILMRLYEY